MSGYKVVPVEPTAEMLEAYQESSSWTAPFSTWGYKAMLAAAPDVQGEPAAHTFYVLHDSTEGQKYIKKDIDDGCLAIFEREEDARRAKRRHSGTDYARVDYYTAPQPAEQQPAPNTPDPTFQLGDHVRKTKGSQWKGRVVGTYSTSLTPEGYAVESDTEKGSVQIYPVGALELVAARRKQEST